MSTTNQSRVSWLLRISGCLLLALSGSDVLANDLAYPTKPIKWIVPYPPGSGSDVVARAFATKMQEQWRQPVIVENRPGAATNPANESVLKAPADGHTLLLTSGTTAINPALFPRLAYDPARDFIPVSLLVRSVLAIFVPSQSPFRTFADVVSHAKAHPGQLAYGALGVGSMSHLAGQQLVAATQMSLALVPYTGSAQLANDLAGGHLPLAVGNLLAHMPQVRSGRIRVLLVLGPAREPSLPDVPSVAEIGFPQLVAEGFAGVSVASGTPRNIVQKLAGEFQRIGKLPDIIRQLEEPGTKVFSSSSEEYRRFLETETARWGKLIREQNIRIE